MEGREEGFLKYVKQGLSPERASLQIRVRSRAVSQPAVIWSLIGRHPIGPMSSGFGEGLAWGALLGSLHSSASLWRSRRLPADLDRQLNSASSDTFVRLASGLRGRVLRKKLSLPCLLLLPLSRAPCRRSTNHRPWQPLLRTPAPYHYAHLDLIIPLINIPIVIPQ